MWPFHFFPLFLSLSLFPFHFFLLSILGWLASTYVWKFANNSWHFGDSVNLERSGDVCPNYKHQCVCQAPRSVLSSNTLPPGEPVRRTERPSVAGGRGNHEPSFYKGHEDQVLSGSLINNNGQDESVDYYSGGGRDKRTKIQWMDILMLRGVEWGKGPRRSRLVNQASTISKLRNLGGRINSILA